MIRVRTQLAGVLGSMESMTQLAAPPSVIYPRLGDWSPPSGALSDPDYLAHYSEDILEILAGTGVSPGAALQAGYITQPDSSVYPYIPARWTSAGRQWRAQVLADTAEAPPEFQTIQPTLPTTAQKVAWALEDAAKDLPKLPKLPDITKLLWAVGAAAAGLWFLSRRAS